MMQTDREFNSEDEERLNPCHQISISNALKFIKNPVKCCHEIYDLIQELKKTIGDLSSALFLNIEHICLTF